MEIKPKKEAHNGGNRYEDLPRESTLQTCDNVKLETPIDSSKDPLWLRVLKVAGPMAVPIILKLLEQM
jgi:hypothetical protein